MTEIYPILLKKIAINFKSGKNYWFSFRTAIKAS